MVNSATRSFCYTSPGTRGQRDRRWCEQREQRDASNSDADRCGDLALMLGDWLWLITVDFCWFITAYNGDKYKGYSGYSGYNGWFRLIIVVIVVNDQLMVRRSGD